MLLLGKLVLSATAVVAMSAAYVFHEGVIRVDVDEKGPDGSHVHVWVPATLVNVGLHVVPSRHLQKPAAQVLPYLPIVREVTKELHRYPNADFVDVHSGNESVHIQTIDGRIQIDAVDDNETVHVRIPLEILEDVSDRLESAAPTV